jgi:hypothetical protein
MKHLIIFITLTLTVGCQSKHQETEQPSAADCAADGSNCKQFNPDQPI